MKNFYLTLTLLLFTVALMGQTRFATSVSAPEDDQEEFLPGGSDPIGNQDPGSSDLELGSENPMNGKPQIVGLRFRQIDVPRGALITGARIIFTVDETGKNDDPSNLTIRVQDADNPDAFTADPFNISSRPTLAETVAWTIAPGTWAEPNLNGGDQTTPDLASLIQQIVDRGGWSAGNAMVFTIQGTGTRVAESFEGEPESTARLEIDYVSPVSFSARIASSTDDVEEKVNDGSMDVTSSDIELGSERTDGSSPQLAGLRFTQVEVPAGAPIASATITFTVDEADKFADPTVMTIRAQMDPNPETFSGDAFSVSSRPVFDTSITWTIEDWVAVDDNGPAQTTPNLAPLMEAIVNQPGWAPGNAVVFTLEGPGTRTAEAFDGEAESAPLLNVSYYATAELRNRIAASSDDVEEKVNDGSMDVTSSDIELGSERTDGSSPQLAGLRFTQVEVPAGAAVQSAYIQFTVDEADKFADPTVVTIKAIAQPDPATFSGDAFSVSSRPTFEASVTWTIDDWIAVDDAGEAQRTPDLSALVNEIIAQEGWAMGNAMAFTIEGIGTRTAEAFDGEAESAPELVITLLSSEQGIRPSSYPVASGSEWAYLPAGTMPDETFSTLDFDVSELPFGPAPLGYGDGDVTTMTDEASVIYLRKVVTVEDVAALPAELEMAVRADDGYRVMINGTEVARKNLPEGDLDANSRATRAVNGDEEKAFFITDLSSNLLVSGENVITVALYQVDPADGDLIFDLILQDKGAETGMARVGCTGENDPHISCFTSLVPKSQDDTLGLPSTHAFQFIAREGDNYTGSEGQYGNNFDFTGYVPKDGSSTSGYLSINYETTPGGVSISEIEFNDSLGIWEVLSSGRVDFSEVEGTARNCSGTVTPWGTIITCEETTPSGDANMDGYQDIGWCVEIDPATRTILDYGTGSPQKLWALGRMSHENVVVAADNRTVYFGEDTGDGSVYKFVADEAENLASGTLYALVVTEGFDMNADPVGTTATWVEVPNTTPEEANNVTENARALGATTFAGVEDAEINPLTGEIYFAVKGVGRVYAFTDNGNDVSNFRTFIGGQMYRMQTEFGVVSENFGLGADNLTFDDRGNLYILQDGGKNFIWMAGANHTQENPEVELFFHTPNGAEPTGMTFTPDFKYMFLSVQHPSATTPQTDAAGNTFPFTRDAAIVVAREENLGFGVELEPDFTLRIMHNNDGESKIEPSEVAGMKVGGAAEFKTVVDSLRGAGLASVLLSSGDNFLAGNAFNASLNRAEGLPYYDAIVLDSLDYDAIALGNHDFDFGPDVLAKMISDISVTMPTYLGANLDFSQEPALQALADAGRIAPRTIVEVDGQQIGVISLIYEELARISSPRQVIVLQNIEEIARQQIAALEAEGINKIVMISHLQSINNELELIGKLTGVDIWIAGGGDELLTNDPSIALPGMTVFGEYPLPRLDAEGNTVYLVTTPGEYRYVGNLMVTFDGNGVVKSVNEMSDLVPVFDVAPDSALQANVTDSIIAYTASLDKNIIAVTEPALDGTRGGVRTRETNQGNLVADAYVYLVERDRDAYGLQAGVPVVGVQNGGGMRDDEIIPAGSDISEKKVSDILAFPNTLVVMDKQFDPFEIDSILEHAVSNVENVDGRFLQVSGIEFVWDPTREPYHRILSAQLADGTPIIENYEVIPSAPSIYITTNNFTAGGGDGFEEFIGTDLINLPFTYDRALFTYLIEGLNGVVTADQYPAGGEGRIRRGLGLIGDSEKTFDLFHVASYATGVFDEGAAEILAYDAASQRIFFTNADANTVTALNIADVGNPVKLFDIDMSTYGDGVNSVAHYNGVIAVAAEAEAVDANGKVVFFDTDGNYLNDVEVGVLPDMVTFTNDGTKVLSANEGEPSDDYLTDPEGSVSIIDISGGVLAATVTNISFAGLNDQIDDLRNAGVRIFGPGATVAQDLEPEYIAITEDDGFAFVALQEANAVARINLTTSTLEGILPLGFKDHSLLNNGLDASNRSDAIDIRPWPILGMYLPDAMKAVNINGVDYIVTANEGDARDYDGYSEETRVEDLVLDSTAYPNYTELQMEENLGRLLTTTANGDTDGDGDVDQIYSYGARSFTIWDANANVVFDSRDKIEQVLAELFPMDFNSNNDENDSFKARSDDKGPEPEAIEIVKLGDDVFALVGLERIGGIMVFDITNPADAKYVSYVNNRDFTVADATTPEVGDLGVEDIVFVPASESPVGTALVLTANEVSGTVSIFAVNEMITSAEEVFDLDEVSFQANPNPFDTDMWISYDLSETSDVEITLVDLAGRPIRNMVSARQPSGYHSLRVNTENLPTGMYVILVEVNGKIAPTKVIKQ